MQVSLNKNSSQVDWGKIRLVVSEIGTVAITDGCHSADKFSGTILHSAERNLIGAYSVEFRKALFKEYKEEITLSND